MTTIYVLLLSGGKYYVGKTDNIHGRIQDHFSGRGAAWTREHAPLKVVKTVSGASPFDEDKIVKEMMAKHGIDKVRGGSYANRVLDKTQKAALVRELRGASDRCMTCGHTGHFAAWCSRDKDYSSVDSDSDSEDDSECYSVSDSSSEDDSDDYDGCS